MSTTMSTPAGGQPRASRASAASIVAGAGLTPALSDLVLRVTGACRLWKRERAEVARELCAHFRDGLESGETEASLTASFGDVRRAAGLITCARKRLRPLWWRAGRGSLYGAAACLLLSAGAYGVLAARYFSGAPTLRHNYMAELNAPVLASPVDSRAWPEYQEALKAFGTIPDFQNEAEFKADAPGDRDWQAMREWLSSHHDAIARVRTAAARPQLGFVLSPDLTEEYLDLLRATGRGFDRTPSPTPENPLLLGVLLPHLGEVRKLARWLRADMRVAAAEGDSARVLADVRAMLGMGEQCLGEHFVISNLVGLAVADLAVDGLLKDALAPGTLSDAELRTLAHVLAGFAGGHVRLNAVGERAMFDDIVQRFYTDDGRGDGRCVYTTEEDRLYHEFGVVRPNATILPYKAYRPLQSAVLPSRREVNAMIDRFASQAVADEALPPWRHDERRADALYDIVGEAAIYPVMPMVRSLHAGSGTPGSDGPLASAFASRDIAETKRAVAVTVIALELHRRSTGRWPSTLHELVPAMLPSLPVDPFDGKPLRYRLTDAGPMLYSIGVDGKDDHGVAPTTEGGRFSVRRLGLLRDMRVPRTLTAEEQTRLDEAQGDWVLWSGGEGRQ